MTLEELIAQADAEADASNTRAADFRQVATSLRELLDARRELAALRAVVGAIGRESREARAQRDTMTDTKETSS